MIKPISFVKAHASEVVHNLSNGGAPIIITQNGEAKAVLQSVQEYEQMQESLSLMKMVAISEKSVKEGNYKTIDKAFRDIRKETAKLKRDKFQ